MSRYKLSQRRASTTINVPHSYRGGDDRVLTVSYSREPLPGDHPALPTGRIVEFWLNNINDHEKLINDDMRDTCIGYSKDLQNGDSVEHLAKSVLRDSRGRPHGWVGSVLDALKREPIHA